MNLMGKIQDEISANKNKKDKYSVVNEVTK
jgi:hypothetical protein